MTRSTVFKNNKSQPIRLTKDVALPDNVKRVEIVKLEKALLIAPADTVWNAFFDGPLVSDDFLTERFQPTVLNPHL